MTNEAMTAVELLPCPFCGSNDVHFDGPDGSPFSVVCRNCCAEMPYMSLDDPQSVRWNTRTLARQSVGVEEIESAKKQVQAARDTLNSAIQKLVDVQVEAMSRLGDRAAINVS